MSDAVSLAGSKPMTRFAYAEALYGYAAGNVSTRTASGVGSSAG